MQTNNKILGNDRPLTDKSNENCNNIKVNFTIIKSYI